MSIVISQSIYKFNVTELAFNQINIFKKSYPVPKDLSWGRGGNLSLFEKHFLLHHPCNLKLFYCMTKKDLNKI
jgi:hypothetical protein